MNTIDLKYLTCESRTFANIDEVFEEISYIKGNIPAAAIKIDNGNYNPYANAYEAIRTAEMLKTVGKHKINLAIYNPTITDSGICITTTIYE